MAGADELLGFDRISPYIQEAESRGSSSIAFSDISCVVRQGWGLIGKRSSKVVLNGVR